MTRVEAKESLQAIFNWMKGDERWTDAEFKALEIAISALDQPERVRGHWIVDKDSIGCMYGKCTSCGIKQYAGRTKFCPNCGARMEDK